MGTRERGVADIVNSGLTGSAQTVLRVDALHTVRRVDVLDQGDLEARSTALTGSDGGGSEEVFPDLEIVS